MLIVFTNGTNRKTFCIISANDVDFMEMGLGLQMIRVWGYMNIMSIGVIYYMLLIQYNKYIHTYMLHMEILVTRWRQIGYPFYMLNSSWSSTICSNDFLDYIAMAYTIAVQ